MANEPGSDNPTTEYLDRIMNRAKEIRAEKARTLGRLVRALREREGLTRQQLAERAGVSVEALQLLEQQLANFDELRRPFVEAVAKSFEMRTVLLCESCGFAPEELAIEESDYPSLFDIPVNVDTPT